MVLLELKDDRSEKIRYDNESYPIYIRRRLLSRYPSYAAPSHWHDDVELIAVLEGEMDYNVNGKVIRLREGEGIFVNAGQMHFGFSSARTECLFICAILHPMLLCAAPACEQAFVLPVTGSGGTPFLFLSPDVSWQRDILEQVRLMERWKDRETAPLRAQAAFFTIWSLLYENLPPEDRAVRRGNADLTAARNMAGFIQKNYARRISLREIASSGAVGQSKCCKLFAKYFGQSPNAYLNQYRLNKSRELLLNDGLSITEVALASGFGGASYYAEVFRRSFGKSPTEYRKCGKM